jgi:hypothetical protein
MGTRTSYCVVQQMRNEANHLAPSSAKVINELSCTYTLLQASTACTGTNLPNQVQFLYAFPSQSTALYNNVR